VVCDPDGGGGGGASFATDPIAIGINAGANGQDTQAIAIGYNAGQTGQGFHTIAIGFDAGKTDQPDQSIVLNASSSALNGATTGAFYVAPIRQVTSPATTSTLVYNATTKEIITDLAKSFVVDHPLYDDKWLVHGCLEGPEGGVYYRGEGHIAERCVEITLPDYATLIANNWTVQVTAVYEGEGEIPLLATSKVDPDAGTFKVYGTNDTTFYWSATGTRIEVDTEPLKSQFARTGSGPYTFLRPVH